MQNTTASPDEPSVSVQALSSSQEKTTTTSKADPAGIVHGRRRIRKSGGSDKSARRNHAKASFVLEYHRDAVVGRTAALQRFAMLLSPPSETTQRGRKRWRSPCSPPVYALTTRNLKGSAFAAGARPGFQNRWGLLDGGLGGFDSRALPPLNPRCRDLTKAASSVCPTDNTTIYPAEIIWPANQDGPGRVLPSQGLPDPALDDQLPTSRLLVRFCISKWSATSGALSIWNLQAVGRDHAVASLDRYLHQTFVPRLWQRRALALPRNTPDSGHMIGDTGIRVERS